MKTNKKLFAAFMLTAFLAYSLSMSAQAANPKSGKSSGAPQWSVQVDKVDPGDVILESAFRVAIYENLLDEMAKTKRFKQVFRSGDHHAADVPDLLILKTTVQKYTAGSETRRTVTTVSGATKLKVSSQLTTKDGKVVLEKVVDGNVRFFGGNLRATHNLAHNIGTQIKESTLPPPNAATAEGSIERRMEASADSVSTSEMDVR
jgi:hypothetical protein